MKAVCFSVRGADPKKAKPYPPFHKRSQEDHQRIVASAFTEAQSQREIADYDFSIQVTKTDADTQISLVADAFESWNAIRNTPQAQRFLIELLGPRQEKR